MAHHKRRHGRVRAEGVVSRVQSGGRNAFACTVENLSLGGAFIRTRELLPPGSKIVLELVRANSRKPIKVSGAVTSVVRADEASERRLPPGLGVAFEPISSEVEPRLRELLLLLAPGPAALDGDEVRPLSRDPLAAAPSSPLSERAMALSGGASLGAFTAESGDEPRPATLARVPHFRATATPSPAESRLALDVTLLQSQVEDRDLRIRELEEQNQKLQDELNQVRRALFQLRHR